MEKVVIKPTWQLAWGLVWRVILITLGIEVIVFGILFGVYGAAILALLRGMYMLPY